MSSARSFFGADQKIFFFFKTLRWWRAESGLLVPSRKERIGILGKKGGGECGNNLLSFVFRLGGREKRISAATDSARYCAPRALRTCLVTECAWWAHRWRWRPNPPATCAIGWACPAIRAWPLDLCYSHRRRRAPGRWPAERNRAAARRGCSCSPRCGRWTPVAPYSAPLPSALPNSCEPDWRRASERRTTCSGELATRCCSRTGARRRRSSTGGGNRDPLAKCRWWIAGQTSWWRPPTPGNCRPRKKMTSRFRRPGRDWSGSRSPVWPHDDWTWNKKETKNDYYEDI